MMPSVTSYGLDVLSSYSYYLSHKFACWNQYRFFLCHVWSSITSYLYSFCIKYYAEHQKQVFFRIL